MRRMIRPYVWMGFLVMVGCTTPHKVGPLLQTITQETATIVWETEEALDSRVEYGLTSGYGLNFSTPEPVNLHEAVLTGLTPETLYHYRVNSGGVTGRDHTFRTAVLETTPFRFAVLGDTQSNPVGVSVLSNALLETVPDLVVHVGDEVGDGNDYDSWRTEFFFPARELMYQVPVYVAIGNHEENAPWFYYYHAYPEPENNYAFAYGNSFFVMADTNGDVTPGSPLYVWLQDTLASPEAQGAEWLFVAHHQPAYSEGWRPCDYDGDADVREHLVPLMEAYEVDAVFNGHTHGYERGSLNGVLYIISGGGGGGLDYFCQDWPHVEVSVYVHHFVLLDIDGSTLTLSAQKHDGTVIDTVFLEKDKGP